MTESEFSENRVITEEPATPSDHLALISALGDKPQGPEKQGPTFHEEIIIRWDSYLTKGVSKEDRAKVLEKYTIPANCQALLPPKINPEVVGCMNDLSSKKDYFLKSLQHQLGHGLSAIGSIMDIAIKDNKLTDHLSTLADAALLFGNVHNAITVQRRQNILPLLNPESQKVAQKTPIDEYLFGADFSESLKSHQALKKTSVDIKKKKWNLPAPVAASSSSFKPLLEPTKYPQAARHLNYQRIPYRDREKNLQRSQKNLNHRRLFKNHPQSSPQYKRKPQNW